MSGNLRLYNSSGYVELQAPASATSQVLELPTDSIKPGLVHLHTETFSAVSSVSVDDVFSATYDNYRISIGPVYGANTDIHFRFRAGGTDDTTSNGYISLYNIWGGGSNYAFSTLTSTYGRTIYVDSSAYYQANLDVFYPSSVTKTGYVGTGVTGNYGYANTLVSCEHTQPTSFDGFTISAPSTDITGTLRVYGYRNS
jgi:hypothetical protein